VIPDGSGIILASKILKRPLAERIAGFDFMGDMLRIAAERSLSVYLLGAEDAVVKTAAANIRKQYPNIRIAGFHHGYFDLRDEEVARRVVAANPDFIFVALGFPKQEIWIHRYLPMFEKGVFMGVGGSFDVLAGKAKRAPEFWRRLNLEWLYRLIQQPSRWRRMLALPEFVLAVLKERF
jgi:N-acetylglucosaminyldiphosphoundecaprenol N-acetyl-beta-D-mannosaminyltransferase